MESSPCRSTDSTQKDACFQLYKGSSATQEGIKIEMYIKVIALIGGLADDKIRRRCARQCRAVVGPAESAAIGIAGNG